MQAIRANKPGKAKGFGLLPALLLLLLLAAHTSGYQHRCKVNLHTYLPGRTASASKTSPLSLCGGNFEANGLSQRWFRSKSCRHRAVVRMGAASSSPQKTALMTGGSTSGGGYGAAAVSPIAAAPDGLDPEAPRTGALSSRGA